MANVMSSSGQYLSLIDETTLVLGSMYEDLLVSIRSIRSWVSLELRQ